MGLSRILQIYCALGHKLERAVLNFVNDLLNALGGYLPAVLNGKLSHLLQRCDRVSYWPAWCVHRLTLPQSGLIHLQSI
jgi:hypothetical protein